MVVRKADSMVDSVSHYSSPEDYCHVILSSRITEKTAFLSQSKNSVVLRVAIGATKSDIKTAVESVWSVRVIAVNTFTRVGKSRRRGRSVGFSPDCKFAIVKLDSEDRLSFF